MEVILNSHQSYLVLASHENLVLFPVRNLLQWENDSSSVWSELAATSSALIHFAGQLVMLGISVGIHMPTSLC